MKITAILVSWKDEEDLAGAVASLAAARARVRDPSLETELVAVVNGETTMTRARLETAWRGAIAAFNERNVGYGPAANQGARLATGDVLLFVNPDTRAEGDFFSALARGFAEQPDAVALAPRLLDADEEDVAFGSASERPLAPPGREDQFTFQLRRLPRLSSDARELLLIDHVWPNNPSRRAARYAAADRSRAFEVEQAAAAALAVRAEAFSSVGGFSEEFLPAWHEDVDLCARLASRGRILFWPSARIRHRGGAAADRLGYDRFLPIFYENAIRYRRRHYRRAARAAYRALLSAGMVLRLLALPLRRDVPRTRSQAARAYWRTLLLALGLEPRAARWPAPVDAR